MEVKDKSCHALVLISSNAKDAPRVEFGYDGTIDYRNFDPNPIVHGLMEAVRSVLIDNPLMTARVLIDIAERQATAIKEKADALDNVT